jgi:hypothetical protein
MLPEKSFVSNLVPSNWRERLRRVIGSPTISTPETSTQPAIWYTGLAAEPAEFSKQLVDLDLSIIRENQRAEVAAGKIQAGRH